MCGNWSLQKVVVTILFGPVFPVEENWGILNYDLVLLINLFILRGNYALVNHAQKVTL